MAAMSRSLTIRAAGLLTVALLLGLTGTAAAQAGPSRAPVSFDAVVVLVIVLGVMAYFMRGQIRAQLQQDRTRLAELASSPEGMQKLHTQSKGVRTVAIVFALVAVLASALLLIKINNTSTWALRYDPRVHEQLGWWFMGVGLLWLVTIVCGALWVVASRNISRVTAQRVAAIRSRLVEIETELEARADGPKADLRAERQLLESELRQLGA
jgi:hypothetical protein